MLASHSGLPDSWMALLNGAVGLAVAGYGLATWRKTRLTRKWPSVAGKVLGTRVTCRTSNRGGPQYFGHVDYEYSVGGQTLQGNRRLVGGAIPDSQLGADLLCSRYSVGATVWVFYNPADPGDAVLEHSASAAGRWLLLVVLLLGFALWFGYRAAA